MLRFRFSVLLGFIHSIDPASQSLVCNGSSFKRTRPKGYRNIGDEIETTGSDSNMPSQEQIFVNRDLNLSKVLSM